MTGENTPKDFDPKTIVPEHLDIEVDRTYVDEDGNFVKIDYCVLLREKVDSPSTFITYSGSTLR